MRLVSLAIVAGLALAAMATPAFAASPCPQDFYEAQEPAPVGMAFPGSDRELCFSEYAVLHSGAWREPVWSAEHLTAAQITAASAESRTGAFHAETRLPPDERATNADYLKSGYDKGHASPVGDMDTVTAKDESFSLANMHPQLPMMNRAIWLGVETAVRGLAVRDGEIWVVTGPEIGPHPIMLNGRVAVPVASWKAVFDPKIGAGAYLCRNDGVEQCEVVSIVVLEALVDLDPFPAVPEAVKAIAAPLPPPDPKFIHPVK